MGYTHYIHQYSSFTNQQWSDFCKEVRKLFKEHKGILAGPHGGLGTKPKITDTFISFNGVEDDSHETCHITKTVGDDNFNFCKTAQKPYDEVVVAIYKLVRQILPDTELSSDGGEWVFGITHQEIVEGVSLTEIKVVVAGFDSDGERDFCFVKVSGTDEQIGDGDHYEIACQFAEREFGYDPSFALDENDRGFQAFDDGAFAWETASIMAI